MQRKALLLYKLNYRWHNHLDPDVKKIPLTDEEEKLIFQGHQKHGNRWADIAKMLNGRTDNVVKNFFYSTLRRQLRKISKKIKGRRRKEPAEITMSYVKQIMKENKIPYSDLDNENVKEALMNLDDSEDEKMSAVKDHEDGRYSLYYYNSSLP